MLALLLSSVFPAQSFSATGYYATIDIIVSFCYNTILQSISSTSTVQMASSIPSILSRNLPAAAAVVGATGGGVISSLLCNNNDDNNTGSISTFGFMSSTQVLCEASSKDNKPNPFITPQPRETLIRKRVSSMV